MTNEHLARIARDHGIRLMVRFGSTVTGNEHAESDVDIAVLLERAPTTWEAQGALVGDLQDLDRDRTVDVAIINHADPLFLAQITRRCELVFGSERDLHELKIYAFKRYQDHRRAPPLSGTRAGIRGARHLRGVMRQIEKSLDSA